MAIKTKGESDVTYRLIGLCLFCILVGHDVRSVVYCTDVRRLQVRRYQSTELERAGGGRDVTE